MAPILDRIKAHFGHEPCLETLKILSYESNHFVCFLSLQSGLDLIARVNFSYQFGSTKLLRTAQWRTNSEVATMHHIKKYTNIRVPTVHIYDDDPLGAVGGSWIVMEYIPGSSLAQCWSTMSSSQRKAACTAMAGIWHQLLSMRFDSIGGLRIDFTDKISMGPIAVKNCSSESPDIEDPTLELCGPFSTVREWLLAETRHDIGFKRPKNPRQKQLIAAALQKVETSPILSPPFTSPMDEALVSTFVLLHDDLCPRNILVSPEDPTMITAIIDWEGACTTPIWAVHPNIRPPSLVDEQDEWNNAESPDFIFPKREDSKQAMTPEQFMWSEVERLNVEWKRASAGGKDFRNLLITAKCSSMEPRNFTLEE
ncbi:kinase-like domain-containing protein [Mycena vitilis]|nr:kinase-like domain-containing protein [Mycena vitilis]